MRNELIKIISTRIRDKRVPEMKISFKKPNTNRKKQKLNNTNEIKSQFGRIAVKISKYKK